MTSDVQPSAGMPPRPPKGTRWGGREKGTPNKVNQSIRESANEAFAEGGGKDYLVKLARKDPKTFLGFLSRMLPPEPKPQSEGLRVIINRFSA